MFANLVNSLSRVQTLRLSCGPPRFTPHDPMIIPVRDRRFTDRRNLRMGLPLSDQDEPRAAFSSIPEIPRRRASSASTSSSGTSRAASMTRRW